MTLVAVVTLLVVRHLVTILCLNRKHHPKASQDGAVQGETDESDAASEQAWSDCDQFFGTVPCDREILPTSVGSHEAGTRMRLPIPLFQPKAEWTLMTSM